MDEPISYSGELPADYRYRVRRVSQSFTRTAQAALLVSLALTYGIGEYYYTLGPETSLVAVAAVLAIELWAWTIWRARKMARLYREIAASVPLITSGQLDEGARALDDLCQRGAGQHGAHALAIYYRGQVFLRQAQAGRALSLFGAVHNSGWFSTPRYSLGHLYPALLSQISICYAIQGKLEAAEAWQSHAHEHSAPTAAGTLVLADTLIGIRRDRYAIVVKDAEAAWFKAEGALPAPYMRALRLLCAFALNYLNAHDEHTDKIRLYLDGARPCSEGEFDYLAVNWPEFKTFLADHGFAGQPKVETASPAAKADKRL